MIAEKLNEIIIDSDLQNSVNIHNVPGGWDREDKNITEFKEKMKSLLKANQKNRCAYCGLPLDTRSPEIDHIAPKGGIKTPKHTEVTFLPLNLVYACHYCNSSACKGKKDTVEFKPSPNYKDWIFTIVHPYLDDPKDFFEICTDETLIYLPKQNSDELHQNKAKNTIEMFNLHKEAYLVEKAKQILFERNPESVQQIITEISTYSG